LWPNSYERKLRGVVSDDLLRSVYDSTVVRGLVGPLVARKRNHSTGQIRTVIDRASVSPKMGEGPKGYRGSISRCSSENDLVEALRSIRIIKR